MERGFADKLINLQAVFCGGGREKHLGESRRVGRHGTGPSRCIRLTGRDRRRCVRERCEPVLSASQCGYYRGGRLLRAFVCGMGILGPCSRGSVVPESARRVGDKTEEGEGRAVSLRRPWPVDEIGSGSIDLEGDLEIGFYSQSGYTT